MVIVIMMENSGDQHFNFYALQNTHAKRNGWTMWWSTMDILSLRQN